MRLGGIVVGAVGILLALAATWFTAAAEVVDPRRVALAALACLVGLLGLWLATRGRTRLAALLLVESLLGLLGGLGQQAVIPATLILAAAALAGLAPPPAGRRLRGSSPRSPLRIG